MTRSTVLVICCLFFASTALGGDVEEAKQSPATVRIHQERSTDSELHVSVEAFGERHELSLKKITLPQVEANEITVNKNGSIVIVPQKRSDDKDADFYEDADKKTVLCMTNDNIVEGMLPGSKSLKYDGKSYFVTKLEEDNVGSIVTHETKRNSTDIEKAEASSRNTHRVPYYVEILTVVDHSTYEAFRCSLKRIINYQRIYWYLVYLRFMTSGVAHPIPRLRRILYSTSKHVDNYLLYKYKKCTARLDASVSRFGRFMARYRYHFDVAHLMTTRDFYMIKYNTMVKSYRGMAPVIGGVCSATRRFAYNTAVGEDKGNFQGVLTSARLLAYNLGAAPDGYGRACHCKSTAGYLMGSVRVTHDAVWFSPCSSQAFLDAYYDHRKRCLRRQSSWSIPLNSALPGYYQSQTQQCQALSKVATAQVLPSQAYSMGQCYKLYCRIRKGNRYYTWISSAGAVLDGTRCGWRLRGRCYHGFCRYR